MAPRGRDCCRGCSQCCPSQVWTWHQGRTPALQPAQLDSIVPEKLWPACRLWGPSACPHLICANSTSDLGAWRAPCPHGRPWGSPCTVTGLAFALGVMLSSPVTLLWSIPRDAASHPPCGTQHSRDATHRGAHLPPGRGQLAPGLAFRPGVGCRLPTVLLSSGAREPVLPLS